MTLGDYWDMKQSKAEETVVQQFGGVIQSDPTTFHADAADYVKRAFGICCSIIVLPKD